MQCRSAPRIALLCLASAVGVGCAGDEAPNDLARVRLTYLTVDYDLDQPVFVNNHIPIEFGLTATSVDTSSAATRNVALVFSFVEANPADPTNRRGCASSAIDVQVVGDGEEKIFTANLWPTTLCSVLAGEDTIVNLQLSFDPGLAEEQGTSIDYPPVLLSAEQQSEAINQECRSTLDPLDPNAGSAERGCVFDIELRPTPTDANGNPLIDVRFKELASDSSVAILRHIPTVEEDAILGEPEVLEPSLLVQASMIMNGRDPYIAEVAPEDISEELKRIAPGIERDLQFAPTPEALAALQALPDRAEVTYALAPADDPEDRLPLLIGDPEDAEGSARTDHVLIPSLRPGVENTFTHELYIEDDARTQLESGRWAEKERFVVRSCFIAQFPQAGNEGERNVSDCRTVDVIVLREPPPPVVVSSKAFDKTFNRKAGNTDRIGVETSLEFVNRFENTGTTSGIDGRVEVKGRFGRPFSLVLARAFATAELNRAEGESLYEVGVFAFNQRILTRSEKKETVKNDEFFSAAKRFTFPNLGFGFGPVRVGFEIRVGGQVSLSPNDSMEVVFDDLTCRDLLNSIDPLQRCGVIERQTTPELSLTASIEGGIDVFIAKAGIKADLSLANTAFPATCTLVWGQTDDGRLQIRGDVSSDVALQLIRGEVAIVGRVGFRRFGLHLTVPLFSFESRRIETNLLRRSMANFEEIR